MNFLFCKTFASKQNNSWRFMFPVHSSAARQQQTLAMVLVVRMILGQGRTIECDGPHTTSNLIEAYSSSRRGKQLEPKLMGAAMTQGLGGLNASVLHNTDNIHPPPGLGYGPDCCCYCCSAVNHKLNRIKLLKTMLCQLVK